MRLKLETQLENIISAVALMADSESTRPSRRDRIVDECNVLRQALQDLLNAYISNQNRKGSSEQIERATNDMTKMTRNLRRQVNTYGFLSFFLYLRIQSANFLILFSFAKRSLIT